MDFGLGLLGYHGCWDDARFAEEHGFDTIGMVDSQLLGGELFANLALVADRTERVRIGSFLAVPSNRIEPVTAQGIATINKLAPGRTFLAMGTGYTARNVMGLPALPAKRVAEYAQRVRTLLQGGEIEWTESGRERLIRMCQSDDYVDRDGIPIYIAGDGPKALAAVAEAGDGWVMTLQRTDMMEPGAARFIAAGPRSGYTMLSTALCVLRDGETPTSPRVLERVGAYASMVFHSATDRPGLLAHLPPDLQERYAIYKERVLGRFPPDRLHQEYHRGHLSHMLDGEAEALTDAIVRSETLTGTAAEIAAQLEAFEAVGLRNLTVWAPPHQTREVVLEIEREIMPLLRSTSDRAPAPLT